jgi:hypothetical protein
MLYIDIVTTMVTRINYRRGKSLTTMKPKYVQKKQWSQNMTSRANRPWLQWHRAKKAFSTYGSVGVAVLFGSIPRCRHAAHVDGQGQAAAALVRGVHGQRAERVKAARLWADEAASAFERSAAEGSSSSAVFGSLGRSGGRPWSRLGPRLLGCGRGRPASLSVSGGHLDTWLWLCLLVIVWLACGTCLHVCVVLHVRARVAVRPNVALALDTSRAVAPTTSV